MEFNEAKAVLKKGYLAAGLELVDEESEGLIFKYRDVLFRIIKEDITEYASSEKFRFSLKVAPVECGICSPTYREQIVQPLWPGGRYPLWIRDRKFVFGDHNADRLHVEIDTASMQFINYFRFDEAYLQLCLRRRMRSPILRHTSDSKPSDIREYLYMPSTIRVYNIPETSTEMALERSSAVIEACLFELAYLKHIPLGLTDEWPIRRRDPRAMPFEFSESVRGNQLPIPAANFNTDIIRFYQLGMSSDVPVLQFLAFYQVLEYFFITISEEQLYNKLTRRLNDPKFETTSRYLDRLIQDVHNHNRSTDETEMLKRVLYKFVDETELIEFIQAYEHYLGDKLYTKRRNLFGEEVEVKLTQGHVMGNVAKTVKAVRNALVHSSDRYERSARHIPFSESTEVVKREIPLVKFLAERVIIASAT